MILWLEKKNFAAWVIVFLLAWMIFYVSSLSFSSGIKQKNIGLQAIIYHIAIFFVFTFFLMIALVRGKNKRFFSVAILGAVGYGISDELHQYFVPGRYSSWNDVFLDGVGVMFAFMIYLILIEWRKANLIGKKKIEKATRGN